ncbi:O-antigen ligase family protein [Nitrincola nitratireducens]|uniref:Lipid A core-O-antigen ligase n=1 Tax=Nitrincola nitratireducens TaxID=1229521 RepID=W9UXD6_9GAMM|nr:O-antigen ligase family protein [Nitrincola nitratireducens]EXJ09366.1 Lipid A core - O-antigen ligase [Nitrincola nitratireducens]
MEYEYPQSRLERLTAAAILLLLVWMPLPLGSNRPWSMALLILLVGVLALIWGVALLRSRPIPNRSLQAAWLMFALLVSTQVWVALQWLLGMTADVGRTFQSLMLGITYSLLFLMVINLFNTRKRLTVLLAVIVISGTFQAFYGAIMVLSGVEWLLGVPKEFYKGNATGTFVNRNHLAGYLEMTLACGIGLMLALRDGQAFRWVNVLELLLGPKARLRLALVIMVIGLVMSQSRMGNAGFFSSLLIVGSIFVLINRENRLRNSMILISIILIDMLVISQYFGLERLKNRLMNTEVAITQEEGQLVFDINDLRGLAFTQSIPLAQEKTWIGHGAGAYETVFIGHTGPNFGGHFDHAHNDYLQFWVEFGLIGSLPLLLFTLLALFHSFRALWNRESLFRSGVGFGTAMAIIAIVIHSASDFNLQIPANAATYVVICAIAVLANGHSRKKYRKRYHSSHEA